MNRRGTVRHRSRPASVAEPTILPDSPLEEAGFELFVPLRINASPSGWSRARIPHGAPEGSFSVAGPLVRIHLPPAASQVRTRAGRRRSGGNRYFRQPRVCRQVGAIGRSDRRRSRHCLEGAHLCGRRNAFSRPIPALAPKLDAQSFRFCQARPQRGAQKKGPRLVVLRLLTPDRRARAAD